MLIQPGVTQCRQAFVTYKRTARTMYKQHHAERCIVLNVYGTELNSNLKLIPVLVVIKGQIQKF